MQMPLFRHLEQVLRIQLLLLDMIYGMEQNKYLPSVLGRVHPLYGVPRQAMFFNLAVVSFVFLFLFRGWGVFAEIISVATLIFISYRSCYRYDAKKNWDRFISPFTFKRLNVIAPLGFIFCFIYFILGTLAANWTGGIVYYFNRFAYLFLLQAKG